MTSRYQSYCFVLVFTASTEYYKHPNPRAIQPPTFSTCWQTKWIEATRRFRIPTDVQCSTYGIARRNTVLEPVATNTKKQHECCNVSHGAGSTQAELFVYAAKCNMYEEWVGGVMFGRLSIHKQTARKRSQFIIGKP